MHLIGISRLALIWLIKCDGVRSLSSNSTLGPLGGESLQPPPNVFRYSSQRDTPRHTLVAATSAWEAFYDLTFSPNLDPVPESLTASEFSTTNSEPESYSNDQTGPDAAENLHPKPPSNTAPATGSDATTDSETENTSSIQHTPDTSILDHVDFDQWLNLDIYDDDNVPSMSMLWDFPDYGPQDKRGNEDEFVAWPQNANTSSWNSSNHAALVLHRVDLGPDVALSDHHNTDSDDDRPGASPAEVGTLRKHSWSETFDLHTQSDDTLQEIPPPWTPHLVTSNKRPRSHERTFDNVPPLDDNPGPFSSLGVGAAALLDILSEEKKRRKRRKTSCDTGDRYDMAHETERRWVLPASQTLFSSDSDDSYDIVLQPETRPISQDQLVAEVKGIYAGLVMVEAKCIEVDHKQATLAQADLRAQSKLNNEQWQALIALHETLLHGHHDFFLASQHPSASPALRRLAEKYAMPDQMWFHGIDSFLELLRYRLPSSSDHMLAFIYLAYTMMALQHETVPAFEDIWARCFEDLGRYKMSLEGADNRDREIWTQIARSWYESAANMTGPDQGKKHQRQQLFKNPCDLEPGNCDSGPPEASLDTLSQSDMQPQDTPPSDSTNPDTPNHVCTTCNASFPRLCEFRKHVKYHTKPLACPDANCTRSFARQRDLTRHQKAAHKGTHEPEQWFCPHEACKVNGVVFGRRDNLLRHLRNLHSTDEIGQIVSEAELLQQGNE
ncbi:uncharacterized protein PAC_08860 [Phialocephala subalpina]|uniref:C2H2-type domain-containing protein n=1 Tax=Phialocephala subalpina TaxID=576137 RepID=A0A1L7X1R6_9HELO|nr:uncharacterized protein PAC_08860 [Phialocephala subalpina]